MSCVRKRKLRGVCREGGGEQGYLSGWRVASGVVRGPLSPAFLCTAGKRARCQNSTGRKYERTFGCPTLYQRPATDITICQIMASLPSTTWMSGELKGKKTLENMVHTWVNTKQTQRGHRRGHP